VNFTSVLHIYFFTLARRGFLERYLVFFLDGLSICQITVMSRLSSWDPLLSTNGWRYLVCTLRTREFCLIGLARSQKHGV